MGLTRLLSAIGETLAALGALALIAMMGVTVFDVVGRHLFSAPVSGVVELVEFAMVWSTFLGLAAAFALGGHITVDLIDTVLPRRARTVLAALAAVAATGAMVGLALLAWREFTDVREWGDTTVDLGLPLHLHWLAVVIGFGLGAALSVARWRSR